ncbi:MAG: hypothetical protein Q9169_002474 [Polycauliona sp. 2 TL-2023]
MSGKDFGGYKRIVQYFWDPEPRNDDPSDSPIWCLGRSYDAQPQKDIDTSKVDQKTEGESHDTTAPEKAPPTDTQERKLTNGETKAHKPPIAPRAEDREWPSAFLDDFESRIWMTYRSNFPNIRRSDDPNASASMTFAVRLRSQIVDQGGFTSDTGWGCMIRSGQSLLANALVTLRLGRDWRRGMQEREEREVLSLFADDPSAPFSVHKFVEHGASACGKHPGEWFGPSATARCIQALSEHSATTDLKVYINGDGADVYEDRLLSLATTGEGQFTPVLVLVGIRLGIDRVTPAYWEALKASLQLPQSIGIAGGRPSSSHYFVGHQGESFFFLDPHQPRPALPRHSGVDDYSKEDIDSCHTRRLRRIPIQEMDPSMLIGFLIRDKDDWDDWRRRVTEVEGKPVVHVADKEPMIIGQVAERPGAVDEVETLDDDEDEGDGELIERPT